MKRKSRNRRRFRPARDWNERREEALKPCAALGYDRDSLALYLIERGAYELAEGQLRRAISLNPFEPAFKKHLAFCLYKQEKLAEAREWGRTALDQRDEQDTRVLLDLIERRLGERQGPHE